MSEKLSSAFAVHMKSIEDDKNRTKDDERHQEKLAIEKDQLKELIRTNKHINLKFYLSLFFAFASLIVAIISILIN
ncbi:MAG: hypothetical protein KQ78_01573 [Candidatus Izimaplasma bacterium HR2]|nr:MAG: hypothetical protein KQ78_01573 [Candidatus Izimaplasma bacterium HR2]